MTVNIPMTFEELGKGMQVGVEVELDFDFDEGEPMVRYYSDGSGYPGSPPSCQYLRCIVSKAFGENWEFSRVERPDWFDALDQMVDNYICQNLESIEERALEEVSERYHDDDRW